MIVPMKDILVPARADRCAIAAFEFWSLDSAQAVVEAAEAAGMPVILQAGPLEIQFAGIDNLARMARTVAEPSSAPVALHLDHGDTVDLARQAVEVGFTSVMIDASALPFERNVEITREVVALARPNGVTVESELGMLAGAEAGKTISEEEAAQTDPDEASRFVEATGIDALAVAIGTGHGFYAFPPRLNIQRLAEIARRIPLPLVLHGGSGTPDEKVLEAISLGIAKVNICTEFLAAYGRSFTAEQVREGFKYSVPSLFGTAKAAGGELALAKIHLFAAGKART